MFSTGDFPTGLAPTPVGGTLNGRPFLSIEDADPRVGARLEVMAGGRYMWIPFAYLESVTLEPPRMLRDLRWAPARVTTSASMREMELGEVLLPAVSPGAWRLQDAELRLGRAADWEELTDGSYAPIGQKLLRVDGEPVPLLEVRELIIDVAGSERPAS
jgi:type VI secretion system protein ImpE